MARVVDPVTPHSLDAERALLGGLLVRPEGWAEVAPLVRSDDFFRAAHRAVWDAMRECIATGTAIDLLTVTHALGPRLVEDVGGSAYLASLVDGVPRSSNVKHYAGIVRECARLRALIAIGGRIQNEAMGGEPAKGVTTTALAALSNVVRESGDGLQAARDVVGHYVRDLMDGTAAHAVPTGFIDLDALTGGLRMGDLVIVAGRPSTGKSSFGLEVARSIARTVAPSVFFSCEMRASLLAARMLAWESGVSATRVERGQATEAEYARVVEAAHAHDDVPLAIETSSTTVAEIGAWCRATKGLACAVVDYLQLLLPERRRDSEEAEVAGISRGLKRLAQDLGIVVVALSQLNRAPEGRKDKRPTTADLRGSGALEQDCDMALLLFREEMYSPKPENIGLAECIVAKNRNGPTGVVRLAWLKDLAQFTNLAAQGAF